MYGNLKNLRRRIINHCDDPQFYMVGMDYFVKLNICFSYFLVTFFSFAEKLHCDLILKQHTNCASKNKKNRFDEFISKTTDNYM